MAPPIQHVGLLVLLPVRTETLLQYFVLKYVCQGVFVLVVWLHTKMLAIFPLIVLQQV